MTEEAVNDMVTKLSISLKELPFFCKLAELILCIVSIGLVIGPYNNNMQNDTNRMAIVYIAIGGYILINGVVVIGYLRGEKMPRKMAILFSLLGAVLCLVAGYVLISDWNNIQYSNYIYAYLEKYRDQMLASGIFAIFAGVTFVIDTYFTYKSEQ